jgi:hypothetical protein
MQLAGEVQSERIILAGQRIEHGIVQRNDAGILNKAHAKFRILVPDDLGDQSAAILIVEQPETVRDGTLADNPDPGATICKILNMAFRQELTVQSYKFAGAQPCFLALLDSFFRFVISCECWHGQVAQSRVSDR